MSGIQLGIYRHYKGPLYLVLGLAHDANADMLYEYGPEVLEHIGERTVVVYLPLQLDGAHLGPRMAVRSLTSSQLDAWDDWVCGEPRHATYGQPITVGSCIRRRYTYLGPELTEEMLS